MLFCLRPLLSFWLDKFCFKRKGAIGLYLSIAIFIKYYSLFGKKEFIENCPLKYPWVHKDPLGMETYQELKVKCIVSSKILGHGQYLVAEETSRMDNYQEG